MSDFTCPSCGAAISFQSRFSMSCVCAYCRSLIVKNIDQLEAQGKVAELPPDMSPFQLGTCGVYRDSPFTMVGRIKVGWKDGYWNEWFLLMQNGKKAWLAEAQGCLAISFEDDTSLTAWPESLVIGQNISLNNTLYSMVGIKQTTCISSEGELPFPAPTGRRSQSVDLLSEQGEFACIEKSDAAIRCFRGEYVAFNDFKFSHLRTLPGWKAP